ncbi:hypothetical protein WICMUC_003401 [Wickerhamomyces mucosus]|uniref:FHA domain-containing protein n=1 Tax=Wickerhamomyces mucosus TaxID=1378264 RepID=A0A9P8TD41_9ASCO|nr:hypothetical protein WICMUC_003401 [Wickerhamomyces mucosus]
MSTHQFPPSSPFLDHQENDDPFSSVPLKSNNNVSKKFIINSPFKSLKPQLEDNYPTPNPSSSSGNRSSSPARAQIETKTSKPEEVIIKERTDFLPQTSNSSLTVKLTLSSYKISLGRSSQCDYFIRSKFASRNHLNLKYDSKTDEISVLCTGFNGVIIRFNDTIFGFITQLEENKYYFNKLETSNREDEKFQEISLFKDEQLILPYNSKLTLDIKGYKIKILNFINRNEKLIDESETEDELPILENSTRLTSISPQVKERKLKFKTDEFGAIEGSNSLELDSSKETSILERSKSPDQKQKTEENFLVLQQKSDNALNKEHTERRRKAEPGNSPIKKKPIKSDQMSQVKKISKPKKFDNSNAPEILAGIKDVETIQNVLINHLSFSRLSQTPLAQLQSISHSTAELSRLQLRTVLHSIQCIGVIYRQGKDAAGKQLDEEYYYDVEKDDDLERRNLINSVKGSRSGLRNCRKTHKQYFWKKPVSKK